MTTRRSRRWTSDFVVLTLLSGMAAGASAQTSGEVDEEHRNDCRLASRVLTSGTPAGRMEWALGYAVTCGTDGSMTLAAVISSARTSTDTLWLQRLTQATLYLHSAELYGVSLAIVADPAASEPARAFAFRTLMNHVEPTLWFRGLAELAPPVTNGVRGCTPVMFGHGLAKEVSAIPATGETEVVNLARRTAADASVPESVRTAAHCVTYFLGRDP